MREEAIAGAIEIARTPVEQLIWEAPGASSITLWVKRDDRTHALYGGNKVRKLQHILADARRRDARRIVTFGAAGSHHVLATTLFASRMGMRTAAVLTPQPLTPHALEVLRAALAAGLEAWPARSVVLAPFVLLRRRSAGDVVVPPGGSNVLGATGYVDAALELADDVARGDLPAPTVVVVPVGSGGTAAGLACGLARAGLDARVHGVAVLRPALLADLLTRSLIRRLAASRDEQRAALAKLTVDGSFAGDGYGVASAAGTRAGDIAREHGILTDPTYTEKTLACALELARDPRERVLYWHTLSSAPMEPLLANAASSLPPGLDRLF